MFTDKENRELLRQYKEYLALVDYKTPDVFINSAVNKKVLIISSGDSTSKILKYKDNLRNKFDIIICVNYSFKDFDDFIDYHIVIERTLGTEPKSVAKSLSKKNFRTDVHRIVSWNGIHLYDQKYNLYKTNRSNFNLNPDIRKYRYNGHEGLLSWKPRASLWSTGTVALSAMHFAGIIGASDIYLIGNDLYFKSEFDHYYKDKAYRDEKEFSKIDKKHRVSIIDIEHKGKKVQTLGIFRDSAETLNELIPTLFKDINIYDFSDGLITTAINLDIDKFMKE
ncbi:hypothetical protein LCGC14_1755810 [marine sediment metagenome]|uniref:DUF115 domain-containing protein n=1 Tax=marine sediment metagenome TaxID=412755 RepID=A0A0F9H2M6_9ZZZZ